MFRRRVGQVVGDRVPRRGIRVAPDRLQQVLAVLVGKVQRQLVSRRPALEQRKIPNGLPARANDDNVDNVGPFHAIRLFDGNGRKIKNAGFTYSESETKTGIIRVHTMKSICAL